MSDPVFSNSILVIGDSILDSSVHLEAIGLSLETPTLKASRKYQEDQLGGAANVTNNITSLGSHCTFVTVLDEKQKSFLDFWTSDSLDKVIMYEDRENTVKTRYWVHRGDSKYKYLQVNEGCASPIKSHTQEAILDYLKQNVGKFDRVLLVDYQLGVFSSPLFIQKLLGLCSDNRVMSIVSSQTSSSSSRHKLFAGCDLMVLNFDEACSNDPMFEETLDTLSLQEILDCSVCVTLGSSGSRIGIKKSAKQCSYPAFKAIVKDTCGAGDSFLSSLSLLDWKNKPEDSLKISNAWASLSTKDIGTIVPDLKDLEDLLEMSLNAARET